MFSTNQQLPNPDFEFEIYDLNEIDPITFPMGISGNINLISINDLKMQINVDPNILLSEPNGSMTL
jgi:hypothetical protein